MPRIKYKDYTPRGETPGVIANNWDEMVYALPEGAEDEVEDEEEDA